jgi:VWFA-related protein
MIVRLTLMLTLVLAPVLGDIPSSGAARSIDLHVLAVDKNGKPVKDLTADDFHVVDDGAEQKVALIRYNDISESQIPALGPNEFSNRGNGKIPQATVILFDLLNQDDDIGAQKLALSQIVYTLSKLKTADYLYLYILTIDGTLFEVHGLPETAESHPGSEAPWTNQIKPLMDKAMRAVNKPSVRADHMALTFGAFEALGAKLSGIPGRKNLVWVTQGLPIDPDAPELSALTDAMDHWNIAIYPAWGWSFAGGGFRTQHTVGTEGSLKEFAEMTGGRRDKRGNDVGAVITQAMKDAQGSEYLLKYYPAQQNWNNKSHTLSVSCNRKGVLIQTKTGYYAFAQPQGTRAEEEAYHMPSSDTFDTAGIGLIARISPDTEVDGLTHVNLLVDAHDVTLVHDGNGFVARLQGYVMDYQVSGLVQRAPVLNRSFRYSAEQREEALKQGIDFELNVRLGQRGDRMRFLVLDEGSNAVGWVTVPINAILQSQ